MTQWLFKVGDKPAHPLQIDLEPSGDLSAYTHAEASLIDPAGSVVGTLGPVALIGPDYLVSVPLPANPFATAGVYGLHMKLTGGTAVKRLDPIPVLVEAANGWHTVASARAEWPAAPKDDGTLFRILEISREQVETKANRPTPAIIPAGWREAQRLQARNIFMAAVTAATGSGGLAGAESPRFQPRPWDWWVEQLINPVRGGIGGAA